MKVAAEMMAAPAAEPEAAPRPDGAEALGEILDRLLLPQSAGALVQDDAFFMGMRLDD